MQSAMCPVRGERDADTQREGRMKTQGGDSVHRQGERDERRKQRRHTHSTRCKGDSCEKAPCNTGSSLVLCDDPEGWDGGEEGGSRGGHVYNDG